MPVLPALILLFVGGPDHSGTAPVFEEKDRELVLAVDPEGAAIVRHRTTLTKVVGPTRVTLLYLSKFHSISISREVELGRGTDTV